jgi:hypothetical protein
MEMIKVDSSQIEEIGFDPETKIMNVMFKGGAVYEYYDFSDKFFEEFLKAKSKGKFFFKNVRLNKEIVYKKIKDGEPKPKKEKVEKNV